MLQLRRVITLLAGLALACGGAPRRSSPSGSPLGDAHFLWPPGTRIARVDDLSTFHAPDGADWTWDVVATVPIPALADGTVAVVLDHPGDSGAIVFLRPVPGGFVVIGDWGVSQGGNGVILTVVGTGAEPGAAAHVIVRVERAYRAFSLSPGEEPCPAGVRIPDPEAPDPCRVEAGSEVRFAVLGVDAAHVWVIAPEGSEVVQTRPTD